MPQLTTFRLYLLGLALLFAGYVALEYNRPKPVNWNPTYANKDKIPYGTYALYDQLPNLLGTDSVEATRLPVYSQLTGASLDDTPNLGTATIDEMMEAAKDTMKMVLVDSATTQNNDVVASEDADGTEDEEETEEEQTTAIPLRPEQANYLFINQEFEISRPDALALLQFVARGNDVFISAQDFGGASRLLRDSLGLAVKDVDLATHTGPKGLPVVDSVEVRFTNPALARARYRLAGTAVQQRLEADSGRTGRTLATDARGRAVLVQLNHGRGHFYFCTAPAAFTNLYLLRPRTTGFSAAALAYLPARRTWWDEYQKQGPAGEQSLLRVVFEHEALRMAYYLTLVGGLLFVIVAARRRQRIIPTPNPLPNTTLLFTRTVARLYRQGSSHSLIANKKVALFQDYLRTRFQENNLDFGDEAFRERLSQKTGIPRQRIDQLLRMVNHARTAPQVNDQQLLRLSKALSDFRRESR